MTNREATLVRRKAGREGLADEARRSEIDLEPDVVFGRGLIERDIRPRLIADGSARALWSSPSADRLLRAPFPAYLKNRRLCFEEGQASRDGEAFLGSLHAEPRRLFLTSREDDCWILVSGWAQQAKERRLLFLTFSLSLPVLNSASSGLASHFGLTKAEAAVLDEFARLHSPAEIARELRVTINTVRSHLKRIHAKMSVSSNIRLLQIVRAFGDS